MKQNIETSGVYLIRNSINGKCYIGSAVDIVKRWALHRHHLLKNKHHSPYLQRSYNKYGLVSFTFEVLCNCHREDLIYFEQKCIDLLKPEYNICKIAGSSLGIKRSEETKAKISAAQKGVPKPWMNELNRNRAVNDETRLKISNIHKGRVKSQEEIDKCSTSRKGSKRTLEARERMSIAAKNRGNTKNV
jgi:group I intron endonuclease